MTLGCLSKSGLHAGNSTGVNNAGLTFDLHLIWTKHAHVDVPSSSPDRQLEPHVVPPPSPSTCCWLLSALRYHIMGKQQHKVISPKGKILEMCTQNVIKNKANKSQRWGTWDARVCAHVLWDIQACEHKHILHVHGHFKKIKTLPVPSHEVILTYESRSVTQTYADWLSLWPVRLPSREIHTRLSEVSAEPKATES